ncbi:MAG: signal peptidase I [Elusimicrobia bacterium]|nr:signal peptidase I [Elusimicrobiota bacterium]
MYSGKELRAGIFGALALGAWGAGNAWTRGAAGEARKKFWAEDLEWADMLFSAALMASVWMYFIVQAFVIPSGSMRNTLFEGDRLFVNKFIYGVRLPFAQSHLVRFRAIRRGDIVVFRFPTENKKSVHCGTLEYGKDLIKRVVGEPGDVVAVRDGELYRNGAKAGPEPYAINDPIARFRNPPPQISPEEYQRLWESQGLDRAMGGMRDQFGPVRVPEGTYLVMGDNRDNSCDSRFWGPVPVRYIKGKAWVKYWPPSRIGLVN